MGAVSALMPRAQVDENLSTVLQACTKLVALRTEVKKAFSLDEDEKGVLVLKETKEDPFSDVRLLRGMFKRDTPFTTYLTTMGTVTTNASGVVNTQLSINAVSGAAEWSSVNALFDEFFVHAMEFIFQPFNKYGTFGQQAATTPAPFTVSTTPAQTYALDVGTVAVALFGPPAYYSSSAGMGNNPNAKFANMADSWRYSWKNNVRFDPHGFTLSTTTSSNGWQGWSYIQDAAGYGGAVQIRAINDQGVGDLTHTVNLGNYALRYLVSFRSRA